MDKPVTVSRQPYPLPVKKGEKVFWFTSAPLKIYLTASAEERARRRFEQLKEKGFGATLATLVEDIRTRDDRDMNREVAPLRPADDAVVIDSTTMTVDEVVNRILDEAAARQLV
jgi:cytidylate kinase